MRKADTLRQYRTAAEINLFQLTHTSRRSVSAERRDTAILYEITVM